MKITSNWKHRANTLLLSSLPIYLPRMTFSVFYFINSITSLHYKVPSWIFLCHGSTEATVKRFKDSKTKSILLELVSVRHPFVFSSLAPSSPPHFIPVSLSLCFHLIHHLSCHVPLLPTVYIVCVVYVDMHLCACVPVLCVNLPWARQRLKLSFIQAQAQWPRGQTSTFSTRQKWAGRIWSFKKVGGQNVAATS